MNSDKKYKIVLCGIQEQGKEIIEFLIKNSIQISYIVTIKKGIATKNKVDSTWVSYEKFGKKYNIPIYYANTYSLKDYKDKDFFLREKFDILLLGGWQRLIPKEILSTLKYGAIGQHGSPEFLPKGRGRSPVNWSIIKGKKKLIWHIFFLDEGVDSGEIIDYEIFEINDFDTVKTIYYKISVCVKYMLLRDIPKLLDGSLKGKKQAGKPSYYQKRTAEDGIIDWNISINGIYNFIRALTKPYPGAFTTYRNKKILIWEAKIWDKKLLKFYKNRQNGEIVEIFGDDIVVKCHDGLLLITVHEDKETFIGKKYESK